MKLALTLAGLLCISMTLHAQKVASLAFQATGSNEFSFNTGVLKGALRSGGASKGLSPIEHIPSGTRLDSSMGLFGHYRILGENKRYGDSAWKWPSEATLNDDGSVTVQWPAETDRPFELGATYRWSAPDTLDLRTTLRATTNLAKIEVFLASYFSAGFTNASVWATQPVAGANQSFFVPAAQEYGHWQVYPRDAAAMRLVKDGRWTYPPNPVEWTRVIEYHEPLAIRRSPTQDLSAIVMAKRSECFAVFCPFQTENHRSAYFGLFGRDAQPGEVLTADTRLIITTNASVKVALDCYQQFAGGAK